MTWFVYILCIVVGVLIIILAISQLKSVRGKYGELFVRLILKTLPREYRVFNNVVFNVGRSRCQIDHLVISPYGIFVIETKSYLGLTVGDSQQPMWHRYVLGMKYKTKSPLIQNERHVELLKAKYPQVAACLNDAVKSVVVFGFGSLIKMRDHAENVMTIFSMRQTILSFHQELLTQNQFQNIVAIFDNKKVYRSKK